jgi:hypothetical protein
MIGVTTEWVEIWPALACMAVAAFFILVGLAEIWRADRPRRQAERQARVRRDRAARRASQT